MSKRGRPPGPDMMRSMSEQKAAQIKSQTGSLPFQFKKDESKHIDKLARARQLFARSISQSQAIITDFRNSHNMEVI